MDTNILLNSMELNTIEEKRKFLRKLSNAVSNQVDAGEYESVNAAVVDLFYRDDVNTEFRTFPDWKKDGFNIKKGSKAFIVWGKPKRVQDAVKAEEQGKEQTGDSEEKDYFPVAFLFSNAQVERRAEK